MSAATESQPAATESQQQQQQPAAAEQPPAEPWTNGTVIVSDAPFDIEFEGPLSDEILRLQRELARLAAEEQRLDIDKTSNEALEKNVTEDKEALQRVEEEYNRVHGIYSDKKAELDAFGEDIFGSELRKLEEVELAAASSVLSQVWTKCLADHFASLNENRATVARSTSADALQEINALSEKHVATLTDYVASMQGSLAASEKSALDASNFVDKLQAETVQEMERIQAVRVKLLPRLQEQSFHLRRGSHKKHSILELKPADQALDRRREKEMLTHLSESVADALPNVVSLEREVKQLDTELKKLKNKVKATHTELEQQVAAAKEEAEAATWELESVLVEQDQARALRGDMVLTTAKARRAKAIEGTSTSPAK